MPFAYRDEIPLREKEGPGAPKLSNDQYGTVPYRTVAERNK